MKEEYILLSADGPYRNVLKLKPPIVFAAADVDRFVKVLDQVLTELKDSELIVPEEIKKKKMSTDRSSSKNNNNNDLAKIGSKNDIKTPKPSVIKTL
jgi:hypothetical protein